MQCVAMADLSECSRYMVVLLDPGLSGATGLLNVDLTTFTGHTVHAWNLQF
jgi:hypothetical protein